MLHSLHNCPCGCSEHHDKAHKRIAELDAELAEAERKLLEKPPEHAGQIIDQYRKETDAMQQLIQAQEDELAAAGRVIRRLGGVIAAYEEAFAIDNQKASG